MTISQDLRPIEDGLFSAGPQPRLIGARRRQDGKVVFPAPGGPEAQDYERIELSPRGVLWSWTVQRFRPKDPPYAGDDDVDSFKPFAVGYVELPEVIVESRLEVDDFGQLSVGQPMSLILKPFRKRDGSEVLTYAFKPA